MVHRVVLTALRANGTVNGHGQRYGAKKSVTSPKKYLIVMSCHISISNEIYLSIINENVGELLLRI